MNEQEYINKLKSKVDNVAVPDSISPENMKKMLDESVTSANNDTNTVSKKQKKWIPKLVVACAACFVLYGAGTTLFHINNTKKSDEPAMMDAAEEAVAEDASPDLAYQTNLNQPGNYEDYYKTLKQVYDDYYNQFATVETKMANEAAIAESADALDTLSAADLSAAGKNFSATNTQETNIDEGDIVKTDGEYIYKLKTGYENDAYVNTLSITKAESGKLTSASTLNLNDCFDKDAYVYFKEFFLYKNSLILLFQNLTHEAETTIVVYDISDKEHPVQKKTFTQSGQYTGARISDGYLYTISNFTDMDFSTEKPYTNYVPSVNNDLLECKDIYYSDEPLAESTFVVTSIDLDKFKTVDKKAVPTNGGDIYVSDSSIYLYGTIYDETTKTEILKISYDKGNFVVGNSSVITGYLYGNFALNEYKNHLRVVATIPANNISLLRTTDDVAVPQTEDSTDTTEELKEDINALYIFDENMNLTGKLSGIAPGEQIYSARFLGDIGYLVTYENTDPLFSIDLSDPANPTIIGKLTVPGFSEYLHPYADGLLLGIGEEVTPDTQESKGLKLSMFNITDETDVSVENQLVIENAYYSPAEHNHKALMIDTEQNIFGFFYQELLMDENYTTNNYFVTYQYDETDGFHELGKYKLNMNSYDTDSVRGVYIDDYLYIVTSDTITSYPLTGTNKIDQIKN